MARKSRKNVIPQESTAFPDKEKKVLFKAGLYARLSHEKEENIERGTIETQMELMKNYVKDHEDIVIEGTTLKECFLFSMSDSLLLRMILTRSDRAQTL